MRFDDQDTNITGHSLVRCYLLLAPQNISHESQVVAPLVGFGIRGVGICLPGDGMPELGNDEKVALRLQPRPPQKVKNVRAAEILLSA
jgi:hypothetical protein